MGNAITLDDVMVGIFNALTRTKALEVDASEGRQKSLVITKLEEAMMWAGSISKDRETKQL